MLRKTPVELTWAYAWALLAKPAADQSPITPRGTEWRVAARVPVPTVADHRRLAMLQHRRHNALTCLALLAVAALVFWLVPL